jgi:Zn finger protein HypA/HybF involved in hydrogenase expression
VPKSHQTYKHLKNVLAPILTRERFCASLLRKNEKERRERMQAYCMKCRAKREMKNPTAIKMKNGKPATKGTCPVCGTKMFKIGKG